MQYLRKSWTGWAGGLLSGIAVAVLLGSSGTNDSSGRYRLHIWSSQSNFADHGGYRIDSVTGRVDEIEHGKATQLNFPQ
jgi:hypothetical protein